MCSFGSGRTKPSDGIGPPPRSPGWRSPSASGDSTQRRWSNSRRRRRSGRRSSSSWPRNTDRRAGGSEAKYHRPYSYRMAWRHSGIFMAGKISNMSTFVLVFLFTHSFGFLSLSLSFTYIGVEMMSYLRAHPRFPPDWIYFFLLQMQQGRMGIAKRFSDGP